MTTSALRRPLTAVRSWSARHRTDILLFIIALLVTAPVVQVYMSQQASRYTLTAAIWDHHTFTLDEYGHALHLDQARKDGHIYSDKPPGQPLLAVPAYAAYRAIGGEPATNLRLEGNLGLWFVSLWSSAIPFAVLLVLMRHSALRVAPNRATVSALAVGFGTLLLPFATLLFAHVLSALVGLASYHLLLREPVRRSTLLMAGLLAGAAVGVEYTMAIVAAVLFATALWRARSRVGWFLLGGALSGGLLAVYHWVVFGGPLEFSYRYSQFTEHLSGVGGVQAPGMNQLITVLFGNRGLIILTPIVLCGILGLVWLIGERPDKRFEALACLSIFVLFVALQSGWSNPTGGDSPGARYVVPALPFLVVGVSYAWERIPVLSRGSLAIGALTMAFATFTSPIAPRVGSGPAYWFHLLQRGDFTETVFTMAWGPWGLLPPLIAAAAVVARLLLQPSSATDLPTEPPGPSSP